MAISVSDLCEQHQLTVTELAEKALLEDTRTAAIVLGRWTPSPVERKKIASVFNVPVEQIAWGHKTPIQHIYGSGPG